MATPLTQQRHWLRVGVSGVLLTSLTVLAAAVLSSTGGRVLGVVSPWRRELLQGFGWTGADPAMAELRQASRALEQKSALLNRLLAPRGSGTGARGSMDADQGQDGGGAGLWDAIHDSQSLRSLNRAVDSKARLMAKFQREASNGAADLEELADAPPQSQEIDSKPADSPAHDGTFVTQTATTTTAEGPLERKKLLLNDILDDAASDLGPEESDSYHAPETADLQDKIADIKDLAKEQQVPLPPLAPNSDVVKGVRGLFAARIVGKVVNVVDGKPIQGNVHLRGRHARWSLLGCMHEAGA